MVGLESRSGCRELECIKKYRSRVGLNHRPFGQQPSALPTELREHLHTSPQYFRYSLANCDKQHFHNYTDTQTAKKTHRGQILGRTVVYMSTLLHPINQLKQRQSAAALQREVPLIINPFLQSQLAYRRVDPIPIQFKPMRINKQKFKVNSYELDGLSSDQNQFLDDFLKPPPKAKQPSNKFHEKQSTVKLQHHSVPSKLPKKHAQSLQTLQQTEINKQIQQILKNIRKQEGIRRERTKQYMQRIALQKQEEKRVYEFKIAERRIKKRLMLMQRKERMQEELLSFANSKFEEPQSSARQKEKAKSVDDVTKHEEEIPVKQRHVTPQLVPTKHPATCRDGSTQPRRRDFLGHNLQRQQVEISSTQNFLPIIQNGSAVGLKGHHLQRVSTITLTKELKPNQDISKAHDKRKDYLRQLRKGKHRNYTQSSVQLQRLYQQGTVSREKTERAIQLVSKLQNKRRLKLKNPNEMDYKHAQKKLQLLDFLHRQNP